AGSTRARRFSTRPRSSSRAVTRRRKSRSSGSSSRTSTPRTSVEASQAGSLAVKDLGDPEGVPTARGLASRADHTDSDPTGLAREEDVAVRLVAEERPMDLGERPAAPDDRSSHLPAVWAQDARQVAHVLQTALADHLAGVILGDLGQRQV